MSEQPVLRTENGFRHQWLEAFLFLAQKVKVPSKELEKPGPIVLYDAQMRFLHEVDEGLAQRRRRLEAVRSGDARPDGVVDPDVVASWSRSARLTASG